MELNNTIFCATNPARILDALGHVIDAPGASLDKTLIFLPSRRAVRRVEQMIVDRAGHSVILPRLVALGEGDGEDIDESDTDVVSNLSRVVRLARLLAADSCIRTISGALPIARDLVRMTDYLENAGVNIATIDWDALVDDRYAAHFRRKSDLLKIVSAFAGGMDRPTPAAQRNADIRAWADKLNDYQRVIVCGSTASVPATADLMVRVARLPQGRIILPGKITTANAADLMRDTNPYVNEYNFLSRLNLAPGDVQEIDVGESAIDFFNAAFSNTPGVRSDFPRCHLIESPKESVEAATAAEIAARAVNAGKSVLIITPDAAGNQRLAAALGARGITADFSGGLAGTGTGVGRALLNHFDDWIERDTSAFAQAYQAAHQNLFELITHLVDGNVLAHPVINPGDEMYRPVWQALQDLSDIVAENKIDLTVHDARALIADALSTVSIRPAMNMDAPVVVLGTIESRMQTADVVILTGLNDGMFPARGYENAWLPRAVGDKIGLPPGDAKVALMSLDFMTLSCGENVYWLRSRTSGGAQTTESRFLSRVRVAARRDIDGDDDVAARVAALDQVTPMPLNYASPTPPADFSDVYVTELELLIHNPYAFYVRHILRLMPQEDYWAGPDARTFGNLVHGVIEQATDFTPTHLIAEMDRHAAMEIGRDSVLFHFWHRRFTEMAPVIADALGAKGPAGIEIAGSVKIGPRTVRARADRIWADQVMDIKTGAAPTKSQLIDATMPQLGLEAVMLMSGGFPIAAGDDVPTLAFLQLRNRDCRLIQYTGETAAAMINAARARAQDLFNQYGHDGAPYPYYETGNAKYNAWDDLARCDD